MEFQISKNSAVGDTVLDPFCGSGSVGLEAIIGGRNFIGYDLNPFAIKLSESTMCSKFDNKVFENHLAKIIENSKIEVMKLYQHDENYVLYTIPGKGNKQPYNLVLCDFDFRKIGQIHLQEMSIDYGMEDLKTIKVPDREFPAKFYKDRFSYKGVKKVSDLFSTRSLLALEILRENISTLPEESKLDFTLVLTNTLLHVTKLKSEKIRPLGVNNYWIPDDFIEENVLWRFLDRAKQYQVAKNEISSRFRENKGTKIGLHDLRQASSIPMSAVASNSIDYILTDPPYGDVIQYSELSFVWNVWLEEIQDSTSELIVNPVQEKDNSYFLDMLGLFIEDCFRVLKSGHKMTLCFQNKNPEIWFKVANLARGAGFKLDNIETFDFLGSTFNKNWSKNSPKVDLYVTLVKPEIDKRELEENYRILSFIDLFELVSKESNIVEVNQVHDTYSKMIGIGIHHIFKGYKVMGFSRKEIESFLSSNSEDVMEDAKYFQEGFF